MTKTSAATKTDTLWTQTHDALTHHTPEARGLLEELSRRSDVSDLLSSAADYGYTGEYAVCIQDRIDAVNARVD